VLEGSVQRSGDTLRITAQLIDALSGHHVWSERYDRELKNMFAMQDDITLKVVNALEVKLTEGEQARLATKGTGNLQAYLKYIQAREIFFSVSKEGNAQARRLLDEVIALDPQFPAAYGLLASIHFMDAYLGISKSPGESLKQALELIKKAIAMDDTNANFHALLGWLYVLVERKHDKAIAECERAIVLAPNSAGSHVWMGLVLTFAGKPEEAVRYAEQAVRLDPIPPGWYYRNLGMAYSSAGRYEEAIAALNKSLNRTPNDLLTHTRLTAAYSLANRHQEAHIQAAEVLRINPRFSVEETAKLAPYRNQADLERYLEALRKAGLPDKPPLPLPDKPSIAVLPFDNMSEDKSQEYFSDGLTEEIITALSKTPQLFVIASNTSFTYKGKPVKVKQVSGELGVRYVLEGSVRKAGNRVRITAQLVDAAQDHHLWGERYDSELGDLFSVQDDITKNIVTAVHVNLTEGERARVFSKGTSNLQAYLKTVEAQWHLAKFTKEGVLSARRLADEAIALDPSYALAYMTLGSSHGYSLFLQMTSSPSDSLKRCVEQMQKAVSLDDGSGEAHALLSYWLVLARQYDRGLAECERAMALAPHSDRVLHACAASFTFLGKREEAIPMFREALRINPNPPAMYYRHFAIALRDSGLYDESIELTKRLIQQNPNDAMAYIILASSLGLAGRDKEAGAAAREVLRINPSFSLDKFEKTSPQRDRAVVARFIEALGKAGLK